MLKDKKLFLFDIDGVIKLESKLIDGAIDIFDYIREIGGKSIFITNNSTKSNESYVDYFTTLGFNVDKSNFITALSVTTSFLKSHHLNDNIFVVGTKSLINELKNNGLKITENVDDNIDVLLVGYDDELNYKKLFDACKILQTKKIKYYATNLDLRCPVTFGFVPDCGAITNMIKDATDIEPYFLGKPSPEIIEMALKETGFKKEQTLVIGDRLYTDIACGINAGVETCAVLSGEMTKEDLKDTPYKPTYVYKNVRELLNDLEKF